MNVLKNMKIGQRLGLAFAVLLATLGLVAAVAVLQIGRVHGNVQYFAENTVPSLKAIQGYAADLGTLRRLETQFVFIHEANAREDYEKRIEQTRDSLRKGVEGYGALISDAEDKVRWEHARAAVTAYLETWDRLHTVARASVSDAAAANAAQALLLGDSRSAFTAASSSIGRMWEHNEQLGEKMAVQSKADYQLALRLLGASAGAAIVLGVVAAVFITRSITRPLSDANQALRRIAAGDLSGDVRATSRDETGEMIESLREMQASLIRVIGVVREGSDSVATASAEIAQGNSDLSQRTEQQASALQETAASMEQLDSTVKQNDDNARQAHQLAQGASAVAQQGGEVVTQVVGTMKDIQESSKKIGDIIAVIDGIAFQTNILALNAAVEAARAGEQGRGFAVVAGEVRNLAQRCAEAAKVVKTLIGASVERVERGTTLADEAGSKMQEVVRSVQRVSDIVGEISAASAEQASGVSQVGQAVTQMDQATQQNAALVEESAAAAESLKQQAGQLAKAVAVFQLAAASNEDQPVVHAPARVGPSTAVHRPSSTGKGMAARKAGSGAQTVPANAPAAAKVSSGLSTASTASAPSASSGSSGSSDADWASF